MTIQLERLKNSAQDLKKRNKTLQTQVRSMLDERTDFLVQIQDRKQEINTLKRSLGITDKTEEDVDSNAPKFTVSELRELLMERDNLRAKLEQAENELKSFKAEEIETGTPCQEERYSKCKSCTDPFVYCENRDFLF